MTYRLLPVILVLLLASCFVHKRREYQLVSHINEQQAGKQFVDSLRSVKIDTIISYYEWTMLGNKGGEKSYFIYWQDKGEVHLTKISNYSKYGFIDGYSAPSELISLKTLQKIKTEHLEHPFFCDDCPVEQISIFLGQDSVSYDMEYFVKGANAWSNTVLFRDKFVAFLYEVNERRIWNALNQKLERVHYRDGYKIN